MKRAALAACIALACFAEPASAHPTEFGVARWRTTGDVGELFVRIPPQSMGEVELRPVLPAGCDDVEMRPIIDGGATSLRWRATCPGAEGEAPGDVGFAALPDTLEIYLDFADGHRERLTSDVPSVALTGERSSLGFFYFGLEHIAFGWDHLLFVLGLWLLAGGFSRRLIGVITAFTLGHSLTLIAASLGYASADSWVVEVLIAASIVLLGREALLLVRGARSRTVTQRFPSVVAVFFGLVHGLGFAGALQDAGLPAEHRVSALLAFNVGVEVGQVAFVLVVSLVAAGLTRLVSKVRLQSAMAYAVGIGGAFALLLRLF